MLRIVLASVALALATLAVPALSTPAQASGGTVRVEAPERRVSHVKVTRVSPVKGPRVSVRFNTGSRWLVKPCAHEDSNNCYWNASKRGNGHGRSFVTLRGHTYYR